MVLPCGGTDIYRTEPPRRRECLYYIALGHFKLQNYEEAKKYNGKGLSFALTTLSTGADLTDCPVNSLYRYSFGEGASKHAVSEPRSTHREGCFPRYFEAYTLFDEAVLTVSVSALAIYRWSDRRCFGRWSNGDRCGCCCSCCHVPKAVDSRIGGTTPLPSYTI